MPVGAPAPLVGAAGWLTCLALLPLRVGGLHEWMDFPVAECAFAAVYLSASLA